MTRRTARGSVYVGRATSAADKVDRQKQLFTRFTRRRIARVARELKEGVRGAA